MNIKRGKLSWQLPLICVVGQAVGQCFYHSVHAVTSNAGNLVLLFGASWMLYIVQDELIRAGAYADFLYSSNQKYKDEMAASERMLESHYARFIRISSTMLKKHFENEEEIVSNIKALPLPGIGALTAGQGEAEGEEVEMARLDDSSHA